ncbi:DNA-processing protein DprA [Corynebacterium pelargi]|uniref:Uncharacterized protein n=1 Tax=Corynebacterium pelargi TaxID=1471400 RepID=A0A410W839_9CORY|nr:DNA-processing protein DprA [Corynebacterium pelargi]QAU52120.1 hypothetical protein CPELA_04205 [Corynebacterium pelargi]GGG69997.1 DNA processing protein DprA [Corynebacterium pelargi]
MSRRQAWAYVSRTIEGPSRDLQALLAQGRDIEAIACGIKKREQWCGALLKQTQSRYAEDRSREDLATIQALGGRLITPEDEEWPCEAFDQAFGFAASGASEHSRSYADDAVAPHALWVRGQHLGALSQQAIAMVGTRAISSYGRSVCSSIGEYLAQQHWTIVSGGALGVDTAAHQAALGAGGATVAVAACGLDRSYPARNGKLFEQMLERGAVISEYPPGMSPHRHRFLTRNRLVAALSAGVVVVEAAWRSGALNTLLWAQALGKVAMAIPGPISSVNSLGCHEKIKSGDAQMVCSGQEILELTQRLGSVDATAQYELDFAADPIQRLPRNELRVFDALSTRPQGAEDISQQSGLSMALCMHLLVTLEHKGLIQREGARWLRAQ